jgi:hypothetical protein
VAPATCRAEDEHRQLKRNSDKGIFQKPIGGALEPKRPVILLCVSTSIYQHSRATGFPISDSRTTYSSTGHNRYGVLRHRWCSSCSISYRQRSTQTESSMCFCTAIACSISGPLSQIKCMTNSQTGRSRARVAHGTLMASSGWLCR